MSGGMDQDGRLQVFHQYRGLLFSIAYRMLGTVADAEDMVQETFLRWQQSTESEVQSPRAFLVTIVSRLCINHLQSARVQREEYPGHWLPEPLVTGTESDPSEGPELEDSLSVAFLVLLERLTAPERAVFLLREVFDYEYSEIARILDRSEDNCRQILRRARQHVAEMRPRFKASPEQRQQLLNDFLQATATGDLQKLVALLSSDAVLHADGGGKAPAIPNVVHGADRVARAILGGLRKLVPDDLTNRMAQINGELGIVTYSQGRPFSVVMLEIDRGRIRGIYIVTNPEKLAHLEPLPEPPC